MDNKDRILKMLEEGKISSEEAIRLMEAMDKKEDSSSGEQDDGPETKRTGGRSTGSSGNFASSSEAWDELVGECQQYIILDNANETYINVKHKFENQKYPSQVFCSLGKAFDSVKNPLIDSMFSSGGKNRLIGFG